MSKHVISLTIILTLLAFIPIQSQQISTNGNIPLNNLIQENLGQNCVEISNITSSVNGNTNGLNSYGFFERGSSSFPFENGIILTTGDVSSAGNDLITSPLSEGEPNWGSDPDLENALSISQTYNATSVQFNFISVANQIEFNYILASEEYQQNYPCLYSDGFAFLIREAGSGAPFTNIAIIPGTNTPVNTSTIHQQIPGNDGCPADNEAFFEGYNIGDTNFNGRTVVLTATAAIIPNTEYEIKLVIADQNDQGFDSAVFIEGNSFNASVDLGPDITTCAASVELNGDIQNNQAGYQWFRNDVLINGATGPTYNADESGTYRVEVTIQLNATSCVIEDTVDIQLSSEQSAGVLSDFVFCDDPSNDGVEEFDLSIKDTEVLASVPPSSYAISYHLSEDEALNNTNPITNPIENTASPQPIYVRIEDTINGCLAYSTFNLIVNQKPEFTEPDPIIACEDQYNENVTFVDIPGVAETIANNNPNLAVSFHYSAIEAENGWNPILFPYPNPNTSQTLHVRIFDVTSGCFSTTTLEVIFQDRPPTNTENQWINSCEQDFDGFETFDLTSVVGNVLNGLTNMNVTFHEFFGDAFAGTNPIPNPESYENVVQTFQIVYIRVEDPDTGCFSITELELHANIIQTSFNTEAFQICDDPSNDGVGAFNLEDVETHLEQGYDEFETTFYETEDDQFNQTNPINETVPYTVTDGGTTIYATVVSGDCIEYVTIPLIVAPPIDLDPVTVDYCDENDDGFTGIPLTSFNAAAAQGLNAYNVRYYLSEQDALNEDNQLPDIIFNNSNPQIVYARVTDSNSGCYDVTSMAINIVTAPTVSSPNPITICDEDSDGIASVNLLPAISEIVSDPSIFDISFYTNYNLALTGTDPIEDPENFVTQSQAIQIRVESSVTGCFSIVQLNVFINTLPEFIDITNFENCEADISGQADFFFYLKDAEILNGQFDKQVLYYETAEDAENGTNPIDKFAAYQNTSNPQTIYVRVENFTDPNCFGTSSFELEVGSLPIYNPATDLFVCDDITNDGFVTIDLSGKIEEISEGSPEDLTITFYSSLFDAESALNPIGLEFTNSSNPQTLYARIDNGTYCNGISDFEVNIISAPIVTPASDRIACDDNYDGILTWDLTLSEVEILDIRQDNIEVSYFENESDLETNTNPIVDPENFNNSSNPQTVYVRVNNTLSNCFVSIPITLSVNLPPEVNDFGSIEICDNTTDTFDLSSVNSIITNTPTETIITYHSSLEDAENNNNELPLTLNYTQAVTDVFARLSFSDTGCYTTYAFQLIVHPLPVANAPMDMETCDDTSNDMVEPFVLSDQNLEILQDQDSDIFEVTFHNSLMDSETGGNPLPEIYASGNGETIYVRVTNSQTGCYSLTQFNTIIYEAPAAVDPLVLCDDDYDGLTVFDLTVAEANLYTTLPDNVVISYFENDSDLETDLNPISEPWNYSNLSNPQTVFIKVFNTSANCFTSVPLEIRSNLPPVLNDLDTYTICDNDESSFDLTVINAIATDSNEDLSFSYYLTETDALNAINPIDTNYIYNTNEALIYFRTEFLSTGCYAVDSFTLLVNPRPTANEVPDLEQCDDDYDGLIDFNLDIQTFDILGNQSPTFFTVTYYNDEEFAHLGIQSINTTEYFGYDDEVIYARVENNETGCYRLTNFNLIVHEKPIVDIADQVICLNDLPLVVSADTGFENDTYLWSTNQVFPSIEITEIGTYSVTVTSEFGCATTHTFNVTESESATIEVTETIDFSDPSNIVVTISGIGNYLYQLDDGPPQESNVFENVSLGYHTVTIIDINGCAEVTKEVIVIGAPKFLTPNNDGYYDTWHIIGVETLPGTKVYIFNRYGKLLAQLDSDSPGWDGTYNGNNLPSSDYWWLAEVTQGSQSFEVTGHFSLKR